MLPPAIVKICIATCLPAAAWAQATFNEVEPNESKATATPVGPFAPGDRLTGTTTGALLTPGLASADTWRIRVADEPAGIYRYRLVVTSPTPGHVITIRGLSQTGGVINAGTDVTFQSSITTSTPPRMVQWYGFGTQESLYVRVAGNANTVQPYTMTLVRDPVTWVPMPALAAGSGSITIVPDAATAAAFDTDWWVYNDVTPVPGFGHDDSDATPVTRPGGFTLGFIAGGTFNSANHLPSTGAEETFTTGNVLDFPGVFASSNPSVTAAPMTYTLTSASGTMSATANREGAFDVPWFCFESGTSGTLGVAPTLTDADALNSGQDSIRFVFRVFPGLCPPSTGTTVTLNLSALGGSPSALMFDDGLHADGAPGDNEFGLVHPIAAGFPPGSHSVPARIADLQGRVNTLTLGGLTIRIGFGACCLPAGCTPMEAGACVAAGGTFAGEIPCEVDAYRLEPGLGRAFEDISATGTVINPNPADDAVFNIPLPFPFPFYSGTHASVNVSTNGNLQFPPSASNRFINVPIPDPASPNSMLAVLWDDFNFAINTADSLMHQTRGVPGVDLRLIVQWTNVAQFGQPPGASSNTFQCVLFEDGHIEYRYAALDPDLALGADTGGATIGVESADGGLGSVHFGTGAAPTPTNSGIRLTPVDSPSCPRACRADFNHDGDLNADDLSDFITCYFTSAAAPGTCPEADFSADGNIDPDDLSDYITAFFAGC